MADWLDEEKITLKAKSIDLLTEHWIAEGERIATERIIKLLEDFQYYGISHELNDDFCRQLIEEIKGEK